MRRRKDGSLVAVTVSLSPIRDHAGSVLGLSSITRDSIAWKQVEEQLRLAVEAAESANATKSQFLAMARGLAAELGGRITVESDPGAGSTFTLTMPVLSQTNA